MVCSLWAAVLLAHLVWLLTLLDSALWDLSCATFNSPQLLYRECLICLMTSGMQQKTLHFSKMLKILQFCVLVSDKQFPCAFISSFCWLQSFHPDREFRTHFSVPILFLLNFPSDHLIQKPVFNCSFFLMSCGFSFQSIPMFSLNWIYNWVLNLENSFILHQAKSISTMSHALF